MFSIRSINSGENRIRNKRSFSILTMLGLLVALITAAYAAANAQPAHAVSATTNTVTAATATSPAVAGPAGLAKDPATAKATPFKGSWDSSETPTFVPAPPPDATIMFVDGDASGKADQLGKYTATYKATVNTGCGCSQGDSIQFIAANGDSLYGLGQGIGVPDKPGFARVTQAYTIMGGTGRFVGATGNFVVIRLANMATGVSSGSFDGTIVIPSSAE